MSNVLIESLSFTLINDKSQKLVKKFNKNFRENCPIHDEYKSDIWSLGMTILEASTLISS